MFAAVRRLSLWSCWQVTDEFFARLRDANSCLEAITVSNCWRLQGQSEGNLSFSFLCLITYSRAHGQRSYSHTDKAHTHTERGGTQSENGSVTNIVQCNCCWSTTIFAVVEDSSVGSFKLLATEGHLAAKYSNIIVQFVELSQPFKLLALDWFSLWSFGWWYVCIPCASVVSCFGVHIFF